MANVLVDETYLQDIADAIRDRNGETATYKPREMAPAIEDLHNVTIKKWVRPSDWPDYSKVDLTDQEVIYLTYDCTYSNRYISIKVSGAYTVKRGSLSNGVFTAVTTNDITSGTAFQEALPTNEGDYVVYQITPQENAHITSFRFVYKTDPNSSVNWYGHLQPCVERYANIPYFTDIFCSSNNHNNSDCWTTSIMIADTIKGAIPHGSCANAYWALKSLHYVDLSKCSFVNVTNLQGFFNGQATLIEVYLPHDLSNKCTNLSQMFSSCERLVSVDLSGWDTSGVTTFYQMFYNVFALHEVKGIEDFDFTSATTMSSMFSTCRLFDCDTSKWKTTNKLNNLTSLFSGCCALKKADLSGFVTDNVTTFNGLFNGCEALTEVDLSSFNVTNKCTNLGSMFIYCRALREIIRNKDWDTSNVTNYNAMFQECSSLREIDLSDFDFSKATDIRNMFKTNYSLRKIKANMNLPALTSATNVTAFGTDDWFLDDVSELVFTNCTYMPFFGYCRSLQTIKIPASVTTIPNDTFRDCGHLALVDCRDCTAVPALGGANAFILNSNSKQKIVVPDALYDEWIAATNWSNATLVTRIISASDYEASLTS